MSNIIISDFDIVDVKITDILQLSEQAKSFFKTVSNSYNTSLYNIYLDIINSDFNVNMLNKPIVDNIHNNIFSNKLLTPIVNDTKYTFGNAIPFNINNNIIKYNWGENKIGENLNLSYNYNTNLYEHNNFKFLDFFSLLDDKQIFTKSIYENNTLNTISVNDEKLYVIRDCDGKKCIAMKGSVYYKGKSVIDDYTYSYVDFDDRVVTKSDDINVVGYKLNAKYYIHNLVYIPKLNNHGFITNINNDVYDIYVLDDNVTYQYTTKQFEFIDCNKYYYFSNQEEHDKLLDKLIPSFDNILYSLYFQNNIFSVKQIIDYINIFNYNFTDISICNILFITNLINSKIEQYTSNLYTDTLKYNYYLNYYTDINKLSLVNDLIVFYFNNISILFPNIKNKVDMLIKDNVNNIINIFNDILFNKELLCKTYYSKTYVCPDILLNSHIITYYEFDKHINSFDDHNKNLFLYYINKIVELILFNSYYNFIKQYYNVDNIYINIYDQPLYNLSFWLSHKSPDKGMLYYNKAYNSFMYNISNDKLHNDNIVVLLNEKLSEISVSQDEPKYIVKEYYSEVELKNHNNANIPRDLKYTNKDNIFKLSLNDVNYYLLNGYGGTNDQLKTYFDKIDKSFLVNYILLYNQIPNNIFYNINMGDTNKIKLSTSFVKDNDVAKLNNKFYIRKNNMWIPYDDFDYNNIYTNTHNSSFYKEQIQHLNSNPIIPKSKYHNTLYNVNKIHMLNKSNISQTFNIETQLFDNIEDNIVFNLEVDDNLETVMDKLNYKNNGFGNIKDFYNLKNKMYGDFKSLDKSKNHIDTLNDRDKKMATNGFHYFFKYEFVKYISEIYKTVGSGGINRAFYKCFDLLIPHKEFINKKKLYGAFIAEAPGNFIYCIKYIRNDVNWNDFKIITLIDDENTMTQHNFYKVFKNHLVYNSNNNGDVTKKYNLEDFKNNILKLTGGHLADIITADGGFAMSKEWYNYNIQENISTQLIFGEIIAAIMTQSKNGIFILKIFDTYTDLMVKMIYLLTLVYDSVDINKPINSRIANSEKYIVCKGFKYDTNDKIRLQLEDILLNIIHIWDTNFLDNNKYTLFELFPDITFSKSFISNIKSINDFFSKRSMFILEKTYQSITNDEFRVLINNYDKLTKKGFVETIQYFESRIRHARNYCIKYNIPYTTKYDNINKCPHHNDLHNTSSEDDIKNVINTYRVDNNDPLILNEIFQLTHNYDDIYNLDNLLLQFKNNDTHLHPDIKYFLGNFICKYCHEPIVCKHYNLHPNKTEIIDYYGVDSGDSINCYLCGEFLANIDDKVESFTKSGELILRISTDDIEFLDNNQHIYNINSDKKLLIQQSYNIYKYKQNVVDENVSLMTLIFTNLKDKYFNNDYNKSDIYIIYNLLYNNFLKSIYNDINKIIVQNAIPFDIYKNIFRDLFLISKNDNNNIKNIKHILQKKLNIPPITDKQKLIDYINYFYNNVYLYYIKHYFIIILFSVISFKILIQNKYYHDILYKKLHKDIDIINEINYLLLNNNTSFNLFTHNNILFNNINYIVNEGFNSSLYNKLFNVSTYFTTLDKINSKSIYINVYNSIYDFIEPLLDKFLDTERIAINPDIKPHILYKPINTTYYYSKSFLTTINPVSSLIPNISNVSNVTISYTDKIRVLLLFHFEDNLAGQLRIFDNNNIDIKTLSSKFEILNKISSMDFYTINNYYNNIILQLQINNVIPNYPIQYIDYYTSLQSKLNISFNFNVLSDLDIINYYKNNIPKQKFISLNTSNFTILKYNTLLHHIQIIVSLFSNYSPDITFYDYLLPYKYKYSHLYNNILDYILLDYNMFDNFHETLSGEHLLLKYLCLYINNHILVDLELDNNGFNYILVYIYPYILYNIVNSIYKINPNSLNTFLKSQNIKNHNKLIKNLDFYKNKIFSIIQNIINTIDKYNFTDKHSTIVYTDENDIIDNGIDENNILLINNISNLSSNLDVPDDNMEIDNLDNNYDFIVENYDEYDQEYDYDN